MLWRKRFSSSKMRAICPVPRIRVLRFHSWTGSHWTRTHRQKATRAKVSPERARTPRQPSRMAGTNFMARVPTPARSTKAEISLIMFRRSVSKLIGS